MPQGDMPKATCKSNDMQKQRGRRGALAVLLQLILWRQRGLGLILVPPAEPFGLRSSLPAGLPSMVRCDGGEASAGPRPVVPPILLPAGNPPGLAPPACGDGGSVGNGVCALTIATPAGSAAPA